MTRIFGIFLLFAIGSYIWMRISVRIQARQMDKQSARLKDPILTVRIAELAQVMEVETIPAYVLSEPTINGLALPDGRVFLTQGFIDKYRLGAVTADELTSVIAHEIGHVALGHSKRRMRDFGFQNALRMAIVAIGSRMIPFIGGWLGNILMQAFTMRLSRRDEFEADAYAAALLTKAEIGVAPMISMLEKLPGLVGRASGGSDTPAWLMSHPDTKSRVAAIRELEKSWSTARA